MRISDWSSTCALPIYRADLISGGDAPLDIVTPAGVDSASVTMSLNGKDVSGAFASTEDGTLRGLVTGLDVGDNTFKVQYPGGRAQTTLVDHQNGGPHLPDHQPQPWTDQDGPEERRLGKEGVSKVKTRWKPD